MDILSTYWIKDEVDWKGELPKLIEDKKQIGGSQDMAHLMVLVPLNLWIISWVCDYTQLYKTIWLDLILRTYDIIHKLIPF
jgi:hypothetical protein